jgi:hypothetical protein
MARPSKYQPSFAKQAAHLCKLGSTRRQLAVFFEVDEVTVWRWEQQYPQFAKALKLPIAAADDKVERSLYERAIGYTFESEEIFCNKDGAVTRVPVLKHVPPDVTAQIFWLKNRRRESWRDRSDLDLAGDVLVVFHDPTKRPDGYARKRRSAA